MLWLLLACTVGSTGPATEGSPSAQEAAEVGQIAETAGAIANAARELESLSKPARDRIAAGGDPAAEVARAQMLMERITTLEAKLQADLDALETRVHEQAQSTAATRE